MRARNVLALTALLLWGSALASDNYAEARARLVTAYQAGDFTLMRGAALDALQARPGFPGALFNLALAQSLGGNGAAALATLNTLADMQIDFSADGMDEFAALAQQPGWRSYLERLQALRRPVGDAQTVLTLEQGDFIPEGIALGDGDVVYLGSIRHGTLLRIEPGLPPEVLSRPDTGGHWSVMGMRLDGRGGLWFTSAALPQFEGITTESAGQGGLFRLDLEKGEITHRALLPTDGREHVPGDLVVAGDGTLYTTDSLTGMLYAYLPAQGQFIPLVKDGTFQSPQGLLLDQSQQHLYLADYNHGIFRLDLDSRELHRLGAPDTVSLHGVDGLYRHGNSLVAIQNGIRPHRVVRWDLDENGLNVTTASILAMNLPAFDEPTLGALKGERFYFVANSHWNRFERDNTLPENLSGPVILSVPLR